MSKNIEKQGKRPGYIVGGIFAIILGALLVILYLPSLISAIAGIDPLWDLYSTFEGLLGTNFMGMFAVWGGVGILLLLGGVYFICLFARPSTASTMFRLSALFGVLSILVPNLLTAISLTIEDAAGTTIDLMQYSTYAVLALFVLSFIFYVIGFVARFKQKYHKNRASTVLVFAATFWMLLSAFPALNALNTLLDANVYFFVDAGTLVSANYLGFLLSTTTPTPRASTPTVARKCWARVWAKKLRRLTHQLLPHRLSPRHNNRHVLTTIIPLSLRRRQGRHPLLRTQY